jgi:hypothetical protein
MSNIDKEGIIIIAVSLLICILFVLCIKCFSCHSKPNNNFYTISQSLNNEKIRLI